MVKRTASRERLFTYVISRRFYTALQSQPTVCTEPADAGIPNEPSSRRVLLSALDNLRGGGKNRKDILLFRPTHRLKISVLFPHALPYQQKFSSSIDGGTSACVPVIATAFEEVSDTSSDCSVLRTLQLGTMIRAFLYCDEKRGYTTMACFCSNVRFPRSVEEKGCLFLQCPRRILPTFLIFGKCSFFFFFFCGNGEAATTVSYCIYLYLSRYTQTCCLGDFRETRQVYARHELR